MRKPAVAKMPPDPSKCGSCKHFEANKDDEFGYCLRYPPILISHDGSMVQSNPSVSCFDHCGEFSPKLNS